jgi:hypothetical protein
MLVRLKYGGVRQVVYDLDKCGVWYSDVDGVERSRSGYRACGLVGGRTVYISDVRDGRTHATGPNCFSKHRPSGLTQRNFYCTHRWLNLDSRANQPVQSHLTKLT